MQQRKLRSAADAAPRLLMQGHHGAGVAGSAHSELTLLAELIQNELCMRSWLYLTPIWLQVLNVAGALYASGKDQRPHEDRLARTVSLEHHLLAELFPTCSAVPGCQQCQHSAACGERHSVQAGSKADALGLHLFVLGKTVGLCRHPRSELSSTERGRQVQWRLTIHQPNGSRAVQCAVKQLGRHVTVLECCRDVCGAALYPGSGELPAAASCLCS